MILVSAGQFCRVRDTLRDTPSVSAACVLPDRRSTRTRASSLKQAMTFTRITVRADQMSGVPCIRGLRIPVATIVGMIADGMSEREILDAYPDLELEDVREALRYAAEASANANLPLSIDNALSPASQNV